MKKKNKKKQFSDQIVITFQSKSISGAFSLPLKEATLTIFRDVAILTALS